MKLKIVVIDLEIPPRTKKWLLRIGIPLAVLLGGGAIAWAATLHTWNTGDTLQASDLNGNFAGLQGQLTTSAFAPRTPSAFHAWVTAGSSTTSVANNGTNPVFFDHVEYDLATEYVSSTGTFVAASSGIYLFDCEIDFQVASTGSNVWSAILYKNGTEVGGSDLYLSNSVSLSESTAVSRTVKLDATDTVTCGAYQNSGSSVPLALGEPARSSFSATRIY
jgi:hypothetical protein